MAQTKRKRRTKHRGNAAGVVEARGRTGRPPTAEERKRNERDQKRQDRLLREPTWSQAFRRSLIAAAFMFVFLLLTDHSKHGSPFLTAIVFALVAIAIYLPSGYYMERFLWKRRMAKLGRAAG